MESEIFQTPDPSIQKLMDEAKLEFTKQVRIYEQSLTAKKLPSFKKLMVRAINSKNKCLPAYQRLISVYEDNVSVKATQDDMNFGVGYYPPTPHHLQHSDFEYTLPISSFMLFYNKEIAEKTISDLNLPVDNLDHVTVDQANEMFLHAVELYKNKDESGKIKDQNLQKKIEIARKVWDQLKREYVVEMKEAKIKQREKENAPLKSVVDIWYENKKLKLDKEFEKYCDSEIQKALTAGDENSLFYKITPLKKGRVFKKWKSEKFEKLSQRVKDHYGQKYMIDLKNFEIFKENNEETRNYLYNKPIERKNKFNIQFLEDVKEPMFVSEEDRKSYRLATNSEIRLKFKELGQKELDLLEVEIEKDYKNQLDVRRVKIQSMEHFINQVNRTQEEAVMAQSNPQSR